MIWLINLNEHWIISRMLPQDRRLLFVCLIFACIFFQATALSPAVHWDMFRLPKAFSVHYRRTSEKGAIKYMATKWKHHVLEGSFLFEYINYSLFLEILIRCWALLWENFWHSLGKISEINLTIYTQSFTQQNSFFTASNHRSSSTTVHCALLSLILLSTQQLLYDTKHCLIFLCLSLQGYFSTLSSIIRYLLWYV